MALIKCPECGKEISENAISCPNCGEPMKGQRFSGEVDSGTDNFSVTGNTRIDLSASANVEITKRTDMLSQQGKNVINVQKSEPQPITLGVTVWRMDITIIWNASLDNPTYKQYMYSQASDSYSSGKYEEALKLFKRLGDYSDSINMIESCTRKIEDQKAEIQREKEIEQAIGKAPSDTGKGLKGLAWFFLGFDAVFILVGLFMNAGDTIVSFFTMPWIWIPSAWAIIYLIYKQIQKNSYEKKKNAYNKQRKEQ